MGTTRLPCRLVSLGVDEIGGLTPTDPRQAEVEPLEDDQPAPREVLILGTAHVVPIEDAIRHHVHRFAPDAVALELDQARLRGLLTDPEEREKPGFGYGLIAKFQQKVARDLGGEVGEEMLAAREAATMRGIPVALVDRPVQQTLDRLLDEMGWWERAKVLGSVLASFLPGQRFEDELQRALDGDPELVDEVAERFPAVKKVLIDERDVFMADRVRRLVEDHPRVVLVVGDAHVPGVIEQLHLHVDEIETVRVAELRAFDPVQVIDPAEDDGPTAPTESAEPAAGDADERSGEGA
jgi:pheromone shutdown protein TraB